MGKSLYLIYQQTWEGIVITFDFLAEHTEYEFETIQKRWREKKRRRGRRFLILKFKQIFFCFLE